MSGRTDPAPSKWAYRMERLWLRPGVRAFARRGLPALVALAMLGAWGADAARRDAAADAVGDAVRMVQDRPEFEVRHLRIEGARPDLRAAIGAALSLDLPESRFRLDLDAIRRAVEALAPVRSAEAQLRDGGLLLLRVVERTPAVAVLAEGGIDVLDGEGVALARMELIEEVGALPLLAGRGAEAAVPEALALTAAAAPLHDRLVGLARVGGRRWDVVLSDEQRILLPEDGPAEALGRALALHDAQEVLDRNVAVLDLRLRGRATLRLRAEARAALVAMRAREREAERMKEAEAR